MTKKRKSDGIDEANKRPRIQHLTFAETLKSILKHKTKFQCCLCKQVYKNDRNLRRHDDNMNHREPFEYVIKDTKDQYVSILRPEIMNELKIDQFDNGGSMQHHHP